MQVLADMVSQSDRQHPGGKNVGRRAPLTGSGSWPIVFVIGIEHLQGLMGAAHSGEGASAHQLAGPLRIPMYITQNGIATTDETIRDLFFKRYLFSLSKAISDGYDVRGYCYWSLFDVITNSFQSLNVSIQNNNFILSLP